MTNKTPPAEGTHRDPKPVDEEPRAGSASRPGEKRIAGWVPTEVQRELQIFGIRQDNEAWGSVSDLVRVVMTWFITEGPGTGKSSGGGEMFGKKIAWETVADDKAKSRR